MKKTYFKPLHVPETWQHFWSKYPEGYTILESLMSWVSQVDEMSKWQNKLTDKYFDMDKLVADFIEDFGGNLDNTVTDILEEWQSSGILDIVISEALNTQITNVYNQLSELSLDVTKPPAPLTPLVLDGTDETDNFQAILDYKGANGGGVVYIPPGTLGHTFNTIPNNVTLEGAGKQSIVRLIDNFNSEGATRKPSGLYCGENVDFFAVKKITYDGNASNNMPVVSDSRDYDNFYSHGITNRFIDKTKDPYTQDTEDKTAKDFLVEDVTIKDTVRNCLLITGKSGQTGTVRNVLLENSHSDHMIYESNNNSKVHFSNITTKGFWRGACIVASNGVYEGVKHINPLKNPHNIYNLTYYVQLRNYAVGSSKTQVNFINMQLDLVLDSFHAIINEQHAGANYSIENVQVNQKDSAHESIYGSSFSFILTNGTGKAYVNNVEFNDIITMNIVYANDNTENLEVHNITLNYSGLRIAPYTDSVLGVNSEKSPVRNIHFKNIVVKEKAPRLLYFHKSPSHTQISVFTNVSFDNVNLTTNNPNTNLLDVLTNMDRYTGNRISILNSFFTGYASMGTTLLPFRDNFHLIIDNTIFNDIRSNEYKTITLPTGTQEKEIDFGYIMTVPRTVVARPRYNPKNVPKITVRSLKMKVEFDQPVDSYEEILISTFF